MSGSVAASFLFSHRQINISTSLSSKRFAGHLCAGEH